MKFEFKIGRSPPGMDPKKDDKDKKKKNSDKEGFEGFDGEPKYQYGFFGLLTGLILSYLYENMGFDLGEQSTMNAFLNVSYSSKWTNQMRLCLGRFKRWCTESQSSKSRKSILPIWWWTRKGL